MNENKTQGAATFIQGEGEVQHLFRVEPGIPADYALEQASIMLDSVRRLTLLSGLENDGALNWASHYLSAMAKALVDDVGVG